jgi:vacuolar-type H+-ATPase subunit I/STV1
MVLVSAWDGYIAANPGFRGDVATPPPPPTAVGTQAFLAAVMIVLGYFIALIASLVRVRRTSGGWMLLRALAALTPIPIFWLWLTSYFPFLVSNICSDCTPPQPIIPDVFQLVGNVLAGAALLGLVCFVVFVVIAILSFARTRRATEH